MDARLREDDAPRSADEFSITKSRHPREGGGPSEATPTEDQIDPRLAGTPLSGPRPTLSNPLFILNRVPGMMAQTRT